MANKSASELEAYGAEAARSYSCQEQPTLTQAVVETVKQAGLSPMQVQRVVERANKLAYLQVHQSKLGEEQRIVEFNGGPARTHEVLAQLNSTPSPHLSVDYSDYHSAPAKTASTRAQDDQFFESLFQNSPAIPSDQQLDPLGESRKLASNLQDLLKQAESSLSFAESDMQWAQKEFYDTVKTARAAGIPLGHMLAGWSTLSPPAGLVKQAMQDLTGNLVDSGSQLKLAEEIQQLPPPGAQFDPKHPIFSAFTKYAQAYIELEATKKVAEELHEQLGELRGVMKVASEHLKQPIQAAPANPPPPSDPSSTKTASLDQLMEGLEQGGLLKQGAAEVHSDPFPADPRGLLSKVRDGSKAVGDTVGRGAGWIAKHLADKGSSAPAQVAKGVSTAVQAAPVVAGAALGLKALQHLRAAGESPVGRYVKSFVPGTDAYAEDEMRTQMAYGAQPPLGYY